MKKRDLFLLIFAVVLIVANAVAYTALLERINGA